MQKLFQYWQWIGASVGALMGISLTYLNLVNKSGDLLAAFHTHRIWYLIGLGILLALPAWPFTRRIPSGYDSDSNYYSSVLVSNTKIWLRIGWLILVSAGISFFIFRQAPIEKSPNMYDPNASEPDISQRHHDLPVTWASLNSLQSNLLEVYWGLSPHFSSHQNEWVNDTLKIFPDSSILRKMGDFAVGTAQDDIYYEEVIQTLRNRSKEVQRFSYLNWLKKGTSLSTLSYTHRSQFLHLAKLPSDIEPEGDKFLLHWERNYLGQWVCRLDFHVLNVSNRNRLITKIVFRAKSYEKILGSKGSHITEYVFGFPPQVGTFTYDLAREKDGPLLVKAGEREKISIMIQPGTVSRHAHRRGIWKGEWSIQFRKGRDQSIGFMHLDTYSPDPGFVGIRN